jgi:hypothetical protein
MWRKDDMNHLRSKLNRIQPDGAAYAWHLIRMGQLLGMGA